VAALAADGGQRGGGLPEGGQAEAARDVDHIAITALAVGPSPAPGPRSTIWPTLSPSSTTMLVPPCNWPSGLFGGHKAGRHALFQPAPRHLRHAQQLDVIAHVGGHADIFDGDIADAFQFDRVES
jgi:hypothetical protein